MFGSEIACGDGLREPLMVELVLIGVRRGEARDRPVEGRGGAQVGGDREPVAGAGVGPGQGPAAGPRIRAQT